MSIYVNNQSIYGQAGDNTLDQPDITNTFNCGDIVIKDIDREEALKDITLRSLQNEFCGYDGHVFRVTSRAAQLALHFSKKFPHKQIQPFAFTHSTSKANVAQHVLVTSVILNKEENEAFGEQVFIVFNDKNIPTEIFDFATFDSRVKESKTLPPVEEDDDEGFQDFQVPVVEGIVSNGYKLVVEDGKIVDLVKEE